MEEPWFRFHNTVNREEEEISICEVQQDKPELQVSALIMRDVFTVAQMTSLTMAKYH